MQQATKIHDYDYEDSTERHQNTPVPLPSTLIEIINTIFIKSYLPV
jgi:hypothetical protein